jgi:hypothetical protein
MVNAAVSIELQRAAFCTQRDVAAKCLPKGVWSAPQLSRGLSLQTCGCELPSEPYIPSDPLNRQAIRSSPAISNGVVGSVGALVWK